MPFDATPVILTDDEATDLAVLKKARRLIRWRWRWSKYPALYDYCMVTALNTAEKSVGAYRTGTFKKLELLLPSKFQQTPCSKLVTYNDARSTTHADVLKLFDTAIAELESKTL